MMPPHRHAARHPPLPTFPSTEGTSTVMTSLATINPMLKLKLRPLPENMAFSHSGIVKMPTKLVTTAPGGGVRWSEVCRTPQPRIPAPVSPD